MQCQDTARICHEYTRRYHHRVGSAPGRHDVIEPIAHLVFGHPANSLQALRPPALVAVRAWTVDARPGKCLDSQHIPAGVALECGSLADCFKIRALSFRRQLLPPLLSRGSAD